MKLAHLIQSGGPMRHFAAGLVLALSAVAGAAQPVVESLEAQLRVEERLLARAREQYREARGLEQDVMRDLQTSSRAQDALLEKVLSEVLAESSGATAPEPVSVRRLRTSERELAGTRETALTLARENSDRRQDLVERAARVRELRREMAARVREPVLDPTGLDGVWRIDLESLGITGMINFDSNGTLVTGSYRLADGSQGSIRGTLTSNRLDLDRIDWTRGYDTKLRGTLDASAGVIEGTWTAVDVSGGAPGSGSWRAVRVRGE